ncbi:cytosolic endo-beta-N-acetylglucosaminidase-like isoform X1 [Tripterygium wilfordii]|uniref:mannosyl-glycoprotein endo-beta-N-acetylglucosaminidase n=1 Tax=Tripterygium wilfordii TaxID=458696 RepID=A0A7J7E2R4_TRIWF|nr:cytosolic endo-beta-N-acetylglucosaminidase 1-like [Tripterygium wilfordii]KAF5752596.1 cytosolic endo-beta-N-acetylglucosaminidase-like isoform X1 [Tripterygium wilfordii]
MLENLLRAYISRNTLTWLRNYWDRILHKLHCISLLFSSTTMSQPTESQAATPDAAPFDPTKPSIPISYPIETLEELESRAYFKSFHYPFNKSSVPLQSGPLDSRPRILVCHDMQGGYVDDKWVQGGNNEGAYAIWHWYLIDIFVYFSHNLVTLPPPCWTNTAHRHGVKVLGTFITEWEKGTAISKELLKTKESAQMYAERLAELSVALGFDGWLINMEVNLDLELIPNLKEFVSHLTQTMHSLMPGSLVIWYDSITINGALDWQDQLNENNKPFFDICDGIFVNYTWEESYPELSAEVAGSRRSDVYMGIDVFGRNTYGGGGWNTNVALNVIKKNDVSAAIFAPGWVYETEQKPDFQTAQNRWWDLVEKSWGIVKRYPRLLPFYSNFDQGHGYHVFIEGAQVSDARWNNISSQGFQPFLENINDSTSNALQVFVGFNEPSYSGGGNVTFKGTLEDDADFMTQLFRGELLLDNSPIHLTYSVKSNSKSLLGLSLEFVSAKNERTSVLVASWGRNQVSRKYSKVIVPHLVKKTDMGLGWVMNEAGIAMNGYILTEIHAVCYRPMPLNNRQKLEYREERPGATLTHTPSQYLAVLGDITIKTSTQNSVFPPPASWLVEGQHIEWTSDTHGSRTVSLKIIWKLKDGIDLIFTKYNIYVEKLSKEGVENTSERLQGIQEYLGEAQVQAYYVSHLSIANGTSSLKFVIQVCGADGLCQKLDDSPFYHLDVNRQ